MKKLFYCLLVALGFSLLATSCDKDGDSGDKSLVGEWRLYKDYEEGYGYEYYDEDDDFQYYVTFKSNGTFEIIEIDGRYEEVMSGTYTLNGDRLKVKAYGETAYVEVVSLTSDELVLDWTDEDGIYIEYYERIK